MIFKIFTSELMSTNTMVIGCSETKYVAIIDPSHEIAHIVCDFIIQNDYIPKMVLLTHSHWDHMCDVAAIKKKLNIPVYVHYDDAENLKNPGSDGIPLFFPIQGVEADYFVKSAEKLHLGTLIVEVIHTPGHSPGSVCYYISQKEMLISGDTLFHGSIGNLSFPTSSPNEMWTSLKKLSYLPSNTKIYPGHGDSTTIGNESWLSSAESIFS